jgi:hypothetical protein
MKICKEILIYGVNLNYAIFVWLNVVLWVKLLLN